MRKMKSVPIIFLIFMFVILAIPAYAADTKKITSVSIQRIYKAKEGELNPDQVSFKPGRSEYTITYQGTYDASDLPIGSYMNYRITLNAKKGYDFEWLKERNCLSDSGTIQGLSISADYSSCSFTLHANPLPMVLNQSQQLRWKGNDAEWDPVEHANSYRVTIYTIEKDGRLTPIPGTPHLPYPNVFRHGIPIPVFGFSGSYILFRKQFLTDLSHQGKGKFSTQTVREKCPKTENRMGTIHAGTASSIHF